MNAHRSDPAKAAEFMKRERGKRQWSTIQLADYARAIAHREGSTIKLTQQTVSGFEQGEAKRMPEWFRYVEMAFQEGTPYRTAPANDDDTVEIISVDLSLSMGPGTLIEEYPEEERVRMSLGFIQAITRTPSDRLRLLQGIGDSMEPTLRSGDKILVDMNERQLSRSHGIYWIDHLGTHGIKRLRASARGKVLVMSDNPLVPDFEVDAEDLRIEARAIWYGRYL